MTEILKSVSFPDGLPPMRSEFDARGLTALKTAAVAAKDAYSNHRFQGDPSDIEAQIAFDIEEHRLMRAHMATEDAYNVALNALLRNKPVSV